MVPIVEKDEKKRLGEILFIRTGPFPHTCKESINALKNAGIKIIEPHIWPADSPDLNPSDYFFWGEIGRRLQKKELVQSRLVDKKIKEKALKMPKKMIQDSIENFRSRCYAVEKNYGEIIKSHFK